MGVIYTEPSPVLKDIRGSCRSSKTRWRGKTGNDLFSWWSLLERRKVTYSSSSTQQSTNFNWNFLLVSHSLQNTTDKTVLDSLFHPSILYSFSRVGSRRQQGSQTSFSPVTLSSSSTGILRQSQASREKRPFLDRQQQNSSNRYLSADNQARRVWETNGVLLFAK